MAIHWDALWAVSDGEAGFFLVFGWRLVADLERSREYVGTLGRILRAGTDLGNGQLWGDGILEFSIYRHDVFGCGQVFLCKIARVVSSRVSPHIGHRVTFRPVSSLRRSFQVFSSGVFGSGALSIFLHADSFSCLSLFPRKP